MAVLRLVLGDQLSDDLSALDGLDPAADTLLMAEVRDEATYVRHHKQKIALVFAAMRNHAERLRAKGLTVRYVAIDDPDNTGSITGELARALDAGGFDAVAMTECGEWRLAQHLAAFAQGAGLPVEIRPDRRFLCSHDRFRRWASGKSQLRMEFFYREMRRATGLLMDGDQPEGGRWNYDAENRKKLAKGVIPPDRMRIPPNAVARQAMADVERLFPDHFGALDGFGWPTTAEEAETVLDDFLRTVLPGFGDWQDAMAEDRPWMWHGLISTSINLGLLDPLEVCKRAEAVYRDGKAPLNAVEGFIRQILGWREFVRGVYWLKAPEYRARNFLDADRALPWFYWSERDGHGLRRRCGEDHARQRLRPPYPAADGDGQSGPAAGGASDQVDDWYLCVYADAYEWVEMPNTRGMALFADGGIVGSKPYAASGAYIDRMSDYCGACRYDVKSKSGDAACPFNRLYWGFLERNRRRLRDNVRLAMPYKTLDGFGEAKRAALAAEAEACRTLLGATPVG